MSKLLTRRSKKLGTPPGSLIYTGDSIDRTTRIILTLYDTSTLVEKRPKNIDETFKLIEQNQNKKIWLHFSGISDPLLIDALGRYFKLHPLLLEDIMNPSQRSKLDDYKNHLYIVTRILRYNNTDTSLEDEQLSMVLGENFLITFLEKDLETFQVIRERLQKPSSRMRLRASDYLAYAILDVIVDSYFIILEKMDLSLELLEEELLKNSSPATMQKIQNNKRELALLRKTIWPIRELLNQFKRSESSIITDATRVYAHDVYDHAIQAIETVESFRDLTSGMLDIYLSSINQRTNEIMKVLTIMATIFVPLTFVTSLYGMNFEHMPELQSEWGYPFVLGIMALMTLGMLYFFRKKQWI